MRAISELPNWGYEYIRQHEGWSSKPYLCSAGVPTIGFGNTFYPNGVKVTMKDKPIELTDGIRLHKFTVNLFLGDVCSLVKPEININQLVALVDFAYNLGSDIDADNIPEGLGDSTLLKKVNANHNEPTIRNEFMKWNKAKGVVLSGLTKRRKSNADLYFKPILK